MTFSSRPQVYIVCVNSKGNRTGHFATVPESSRVSPDVLFFGGGGDNDGTGLLGRARLSARMALWSHVHVIVVVVQDTPARDPLTPDTT